MRTRSEPDKDSENVKKNTQKNAAKRAAMVECGQTAGSSQRCKKVAFRRRDVPNSATGQ